MFKEYFDTLLSADASPTATRIWIMFIRVTGYLPAKIAMKKIKSFLAGKCFRVGNLGEYNMIFGEKSGLTILTGKKIIVHNPCGRHQLGMFIQELDKISLADLPTEFTSKDNALVFLLIH